MKRKLFLILMIAAGVPVESIPAEDSGIATNVPPATNSISLDALVADILQHNPELNFYQAEIAAAKGERRTAGTLANPELSTQLGRKSTRGGGLSDEGIAWSVSALQTFEWPGRIPLRKAVANQQIALAELGFAQFRAALKARARTLAYDLFAAGEKAAAAREVADRFQALREVLVQRDPAGLTPLLETRVIEATEISVQHQAGEARVEAESALLELNQLRGRPWEQSVRVAPIQVTFQRAPALEAMLNAARTNNFELKMREVEVLREGLKHSLARNERYPAVSAGPFFSQERAGGRENIVGVGVSIPLPLWNRNQGNIELAQAREQQAQTALYIAQREIERKVIEQAIRYSTKLEEMSRWRPDSVERFREAAALADRHYRLGAVPIATYVELQKQYLEAVNALLDAKRDALDAGQRLQLLTGLDFDRLEAGPAKEEP